MVRKGVRFRLYPNREQKRWLKRTFGDVRLVYNEFLNLSNEIYKNENRHLSYNEMSKRLTELKKQDDYKFLNDVSSVALQQSLRDLDRAYTNFFEHRGKHPNFKSSHNHYQSYRIQNQKNDIRIVGNYIRIPKIGFIKIKKSMGIGIIHNVTIELTPTGKYYVVINTEFEPEAKSVTNNMIGIDVGIKDFYVDNNGNKISNPKFLESSLKKLAKEQKKLSRMQYGSHNYYKQRLKVARVHEKIVNQRDDFLHKESTRLISENQVICVEDLNVKDMLKDKRLSKHISSVSWSKFIGMLEYKANWYDRQLIKIDTYYPSSQTCNVCGYKNPNVKNLSVRNWICPFCNTNHDRDVNAAINILNEGLKQLSLNTV